MNRIKIIFLFVLGAPLLAVAETFYEFQWNSNQIEYKALLTFFTDNDAFVRVYYEFENKRYIAEYDCKGSTINFGNEACYFLDGFNGRVINQINAGYIADNLLIFDLKKKGVAPAVYIVEDDAMNKDDWAQHMMPVSSFLELDPHSSFNQVYLKQFFSPGEYQYTDFLKFTRTEKAPVIDYTLHLILFANTQCVDDSNIGTACKVDSINAMLEFSQLAVDLGCKFNSIAVAGQNFTRANAINSIRNLIPNQHDIVVVIYSGHGYRWIGQEQNFPNLDFRVRPKLSMPSDSTMINLYELANMLKSKSSRLNLVIGDCCNDPQPKLIDKGLSLSGTKSLGKGTPSAGRNFEKLDKLFNTSKGTLIINATSPNEVALGLDDGSILLNSIYTELKNQTSVLSSKSPNWDRLIEDIFKLSKTRSNSYFKDQNGIFLWL